MHAVGLRCIALLDHGLVSHTRNECGFILTTRSFTLSDVEVAAELDVASETVGALTGAPCYGIQC